MLSCGNKSKSTKPSIVENELVKIDTLNNGFKVTNFYPDMYILDIMYKKKLNKTPLKSLAYGQYFRFDSESSSLYQTGFYKKGIKDSIWITIFDDYPIPKLEFYRNGKLSDYYGKVVIKDEKGRIWIQGNNVVLNEIPKGKWKLYRYHLDIVQEYQFEAEKDSIRVIQETKNLKTNQKERDEYYVEYENQILFDYK